MRLYATVASERAKKGQGGEWLDINCKDERGVTFAIIKARKEEGWFMPTLEIQSICKVTVNGKANQEKGEKQKGENYLFESPDKTIKRIRNGW